MPEGPEITCTVCAAGAAAGAALDGAADGAAEAAGVLSAGCISTTQPAAANSTPVIMRALVDKVFTLTSQVRRTFLPLIANFAHVRLANSTALE